MKINQYGIAFKEFGTIQTSFGLCQVYAVHADSALKCYRRVVNLGEVDSIWNDSDYEIRFNNEAEELAVKFGYLHDKKAIDFTGTDLVLINSDGRIVVFNGHIKFDTLLPNGFFSDFRTNLRNNVNYIIMN